MSRNWLRSFTVYRQGDIVSCHVWFDGGSECAFSRAIPVPQDQGGSHRSVQDYVEASVDHLKTYHPEEYREYEQQEDH